MIYKVESSGEPDRWVISSRGTWRPGSYESIRAARYAFRLSDSELQRLQDAVNPGGVITLEMLQRQYRTRL